MANLYRLARFTSLKAISNISEDYLYATAIRDTLTERCPNIVLIWTPGHCRIKGDEFAHEVAREEINRPLLSSHNFNKSDINGFYRDKFTKNANIFYKTSTWYQATNFKQKSIGGFLK